MSALRDLVRSALDNANEGGWRDFALDNSAEDVAIDLQTCSEDISAEMILERIPFATLVEHVRAWQEDQRR